MSFLLGLDVGDKRVGVALGSRVPVSFRPLDTFERTGGHAERDILELIGRHQITELVVGLPLSENGERNEQCAKVEKFCARLVKRCAIKIIYVDEYASTCEATELMALKGRPSAKERARLDAVSASLILRSYLESPELGAGSV